MLQPQTYGDSKPKETRRLASPLPPPGAARSSPDNAVQCALDGGPLIGAHDGGQLLLHARARVRYHHRRRLPGARTSCCLRPERG